MGERGLTEAALARCVGVSQPTLNRSLRGPRRITRTHRRLCRFAGIALPIEVVVAGDMKRQLMQAVFQIWDGSDEHGAVLLEFLQAANRVATAGVVSGSTSNRRPQRPRKASR